MTDKRRRGFWGTLGCLVGLHWYGDPAGITSHRCLRCGKHIRLNVRQYGNVVHGDMSGGDVVQCPTTSPPQRATIIAPSNAERAAWPEATENYVNALEAIVWPNAGQQPRREAT